MPKELLGLTLLTLLALALAAATYIHVMASPEDINDDGYPDFWYALNRDDGRQGFDESVEEDRALRDLLWSPNRR